MDSQRFTDLYRTVENLRLTLVVDGIPTPEDGLEHQVTWEGDANLVLGPLCQAVIQLTHCVRELQHLAP